MYVLIAFAMHRPTLIFIWTFVVVFLTFFVLVITIITLKRWFFRSSVNYTTVIFKYLNINPTSSNNLALRPTLLLCLNCCHKTAHTNMGSRERKFLRMKVRTKGPGNESSLELFFLGNESSPYGPFVLGNERSWVRKV